MDSWVVVIVLAVALVALADRFAARRQGVRARGSVPPGPAARTARAGRRRRPARHRQALTGRPADGDADHPAAGGHHPRQRDRPRQRRRAVWVTDPTKSVMAVENFAVATSQIAQTTLCSVVGRADLDTLLAHRADLDEDLAASIARQTEPWGVKVEVVEIKDVEIPEMMQRAMAREAEAERERRAKVISAHGELQASAELRDAAITLSESPASLRVRYCRPCSNSAPIRTPRSSSRFPWTSSARFSKRGGGTRAVPATLSPTSGG